MKYDVLIIGSGLGGLLCGYILSKEGFNVCILEKNPQLGGCIQTFRRNGMVFNTGLNYTESLDEGQTLNKYFRYFGLMDKLKLRRMDEDGFERIFYEGKEYRFAIGHKRFIDTLSESFPGHRHELKKYIERMKEVCNFFPLYTLSKGTSYLFDNDFHKTSASGFISSLITDKKLQNILAGSNMLYAGVEGRTPLFIHSLINYSFIDSAWRLVDGSRQVTDRLAESIKTYGGTILNKCKVTKLSFEGDHLSHADTENNGKISARLFISNVHPAVTFRMMDSDKLRKTYFQRILNLENTIAMFTVYVVPKRNSFRYMNYNYYYYSTGNVWVAGNYNEQLWPENYVLMTHAHSRSEEFAEGISIITYMKYDEVRKWENFPVGDRGEDYNEFKRQKAEKLIDTVEINFPGFRSHIDQYYTSTPLTYKDYTGTAEGSAYGILKDSNDPLKTVVLPKSKIPNLYFTGQNINLHGILGVTITSVLTCAELTGFSYLIKKIKNA